MISKRQPNLIPTVRIKPVTSADEKPRHRKRRRKAIEPGCLSVEETAEYIRVSRQTAYAMTRDGRLPVVHPVPGRTVIVKRKLDEMLMGGTLGVIRVSRTPRS